MPFWARLVVALAACKTAVGISAYLSGSVPTTLPTGVPGWAYPILASTYALLGTGLVVGNRRDDRAAWLGAVFVVLSAPLAPIVNRPAAGAQVPVWIAYLRPDSLLPFFLWQFVRTFPAGIAPTPSRVLHSVGVATALLGLAIAAVNVAAAFDKAGDEAVPWLYSTSGGLYWPAVFGVAAPALLVLFGRAQRAPARERKRVERFVRALLFGLAPIAVQVVAEELIPPYKALVRQPAIRPWVALLVILPLATVPFTTAYSVVFDRVVEMRFVMRSALQYALARYTILALTSVPFTALGLFVVRHRDEPLVSLVAGLRPLLLGAAAVLGLVALSERHRWLLAVDRRFFREAYDAQQVLTRLVDDLPDRSAEELASRVRDELEQSLHATAAVFLANDANTSLRDPAGQWIPLAMDSALMSLVLGDPRPMDVDLGTGSPLNRLQPSERAWLAQGPFRLLAALRRSGGGLRGLLALGEKQSGLPFSQADRHFVAAIGSTAGLALDSLRFNTPQSPPSEPAAQECLECSRISPPDAVRCVCGGGVVVAGAPHVLRGIFRFEQRIGSGGMGVVYRAVDVTLGRTVAIKTLPRVDPAGARRLRREARAMAAVTHDNLAVIHGLETWQGVPFLVTEYLAGGTLTTRIASGPMPIEDVLELGRTLSAVLHELHGAGMVHCDIKPGNIGFTAGGTLKLLDFGLSRLVHGVLVSPEASTVAGTIDSAASRSGAGGWMGTPQYMSPEAARGDRPAPSFDLWSVSVVLFEMLAGRRPFAGRTADEVFAELHRPAPDLRGFWTECPDALAAFFTSTFHPDPGMRPGSAAELAGRLDALRRETALE